MALDMKVTGERRRVTFECGHERTLWFFEDEQPVTHGRCIDKECGPYAIREIASTRRA